jgi:hypothetical protein
MGWMEFFKTSLQPIPLTFPGVDLAVGVIGKQFHQRRIQEHSIATAISVERQHFDPRHAKSPVSKVDSFRALGILFPEIDGHFLHHLLNIVSARNQRSDKGSDRRLVYGVVAEEGDLFPIFHRWLFEEVRQVDTVMDAQKGPTGRTPQVGSVCREKSGF